MAVILKGIKITCENGHEICTAAEDIKSGRPARVGQFTDWKIDPPEPGSIPKPHDYGALWVKGKPGFYYGPAPMTIHTENGWAFGE